MIRLFVGLGLSDEVATLLVGLGGGIPGARWAERRNMHVTLRFVGEVEEGSAQELHDALTQIRAPAFTLDLHGLGTFGSRVPHTLWVGVEKAPDLMRLQGKVEHAATGVGLPAEPRKFSPHVTLARLKDAPPARVRDFIAGNSPFRAGPMPVERFILYRSHLGRGGAEYEALADYPLTGASAP